MNTVQDDERRSIPEEARLAIREYRKFDPVLRSERGFVKYRARETRPRLIWALRMLDEARVHPARKHGNIPL